MFVADEVIPRLRGLLHAHAAWVAVVAATVLIALAPTASARVAALIYGAGLIALFTVSALYHRWPGDPRWKPWLRRVDHSTIFLFIAASYTPIGLLVLDGSVQIVVLVSVWTGALAGIVMSVAWISAPRWLQALTYLLVGWVAVLALPQLAERSGVAPLVLLAVGGGLYTLGAVVYALRRPNLWPRTFGFHEVFHTLVIAAAVVHFVAMAGVGGPQRGLRARMLLGDLLGAMTYAVDLAEGEQGGHVMRACLVGMGLGRRAGLDEEALGSLYYALLLKDMGCSSNSARIAAVLIADDHRVKRSSKRRDLTRVTGRFRHALATAAHDRPLAERARTLRALATSEGFHEELVRIRCERGAAIAEGLGFPPATVEAIRALDEHWDGQGHPRGLRGEEIPLLARICGLAQTVEICGVATARRRSGRWFDPDLVALVRSERLPREPGALAAAVHAYAPAAAAIPADEARVSRVAHAFAEVVDAKSPSTGGHSHRVAALVSGAAEELGLGADRGVVRAALLHDIGKLGLSNRILDKPGPLTSREWAAVRAHPLHTEEVLSRAGPLQPVAAIAAAHHERLDGSGYPHGLQGDALSMRARLIAVADVYDSMVSSRPYRVAMSSDGTLARMRDEAAAGRLDESCVDALAAFVSRPGRDVGAPTVV